ncbi:MAG: response regulator, partial [Candidatus Competibacteraceae bacterium]|nr:response regulator [Candidatus Competibacteraceae bacterium]
HDGEAALALTREWQPQVVFLDIGLPGRDGYSVARALEEQQIRPQLLVALTGYGQKEDVRRAMVAGFDRHLLKPVTLETLAEVLEEPMTSLEA